MQPNDPHINPESGVWDDNYFAKTQGGGGSGTPTVDTAAYDSLLKSVPKATDYANTISEGVNKSFDDYLSTVKSAPTSLDFYQKSLESAGIPQLQKTQSSLQGQIYDLEDTLRRVEPDVAATSRNSVVTEAQRRGMVQARQAPLQENLGWLGQSLGRVSNAVQQGKSDVMALTGLHQQDTARVLDAYKTKLDIAMQQGSQSLQAFIHDSDNVLNVTLQKIHRGEQVSDAELAQAFELKKMQEQARLQAEAASNQGGELMTVGEGSTVFDPATGRALYTAPKTYKPDSGGGTGFDFNGFQTWWNNQKLPTSSVQGATTQPNLSSSTVSGQSAYPSYFTPIK